MEFKVYPMRHKGRRLSWSDIENGPTYTGDFRSHTIFVDTFPYNVLSLVSTARSTGPGLLPDLYEPVLTGFAINAFGIRGFEKHEGPDGNYSVVQEWHCRPAEKPYATGNWWESKGAAPEKK